MPIYYGVKCLDILIWMRILLLILIFSLSLFSCVSKEAADGLAPQGSTTVPAGNNGQIFAPSLGLLTGSQNFPSTNVGATSSLTMILANTGSDTAILGTPVLTANDITITSDLCGGQTLSAGQTCTIIFSFAPQTVASQMALFKIPYVGRLSRGSHEFNASIGAVSTYAQPLISSSPASWDYDQVVTNQTVTKIFTITNTLAGSATFQAASISGAGYSISSDTCDTQTLNLNQLCTISVSFTPALPNSSLGQLILHFEDSIGIPSTKSVSLSGYGNVPQPTLTFSPSSYNFNDVATNTFSTFSISISNNSSVPANTGNLTVSGAGFTVLSTTCNNVVLTASANCAVTVRFAPGTVGVKTGSLSLPFTSSQGLAFTSTANLGGTGILPAVNFAFGGFFDVATSHYTGLVSTGVTLQWTAQPAASYYVITRTGGSTGTVVSPNIFPTSRNTYVVSNLDPGATYQFKINAFDNFPVSDGNNNWLTVVTPSATGATFNGWADLVSTGPVFTDFSFVDDAMGRTGVNRVDRNLSPVTGFSPTEIDITSNEITFSNYYSSNNVFSAGEKFRVYGTGTMPSPLSVGDTVYLIKVSDSVYKFAATSADALSSTAIDLTSVGSGNFTIQPTARVKLSWEDFTVAPSGVPSSFNIYRSLTSGAGFTLIGNSTTPYFIDQEVNAETNYYYKVIPVLASTEIPTASAADQEIKVYVPPQNMIFAHRWILNREVCTSQLGKTFSADVNRNDNYSCSYNWGFGFAPNTSMPKNKWDMGNSLVSDRWKRGCKPTLNIGPIEVWDTFNFPAGSVYVVGHSARELNQRCLSGTGNWTHTAQAPDSARVNYPGYMPINIAEIAQPSVYNSCQSISYAGIGDGNGNNKLRLPRKHEMIALRALGTAKHINKISPAALSTLEAGTSDGACWLPGLYIDHAHPGLTSSDPTRAHANPKSRLNTSAFFTRNCFSNYELSDYSGNGELTSDQVYCGGTNGSCYGVASGIDDGADLMENFLFNGTMGTSLIVNNEMSPLVGSYQIPMLGLTTAAVDANLGSRDTLFTFSWHFSKANVSSNTLSAVYVPRALGDAPPNKRESWSPGDFAGAWANYRCVGVIP